jgi:hypothetical protein
MRTLVTTILAGVSASALAAEPPRRSRTRTSWPWTRPRRGWASSCSTIRSCRATAPSPARPATIPASRPPTACRSGSATAASGSGLTGRADPDNLPEQRIPAELARPVQPRRPRIHRDVPRRPDRGRPRRAPRACARRSRTRWWRASRTSSPRRRCSRSCRPTRWPGITRRTTSRRPCGRAGSPDEGGAWDIISKRVEAIPAYRAMFEAVYPEIAAGREVRLHRHLERHRGLRGLRMAERHEPLRRLPARREAGLPDDAMRGLSLFYGAAGCAAAIPGRC